jgi:hypothetical protein
VIGHGSKKKDWGCGRTQNTLLAADIREERQKMDRKSVFIKEQTIPIR